MLARLTTPTPAAGRHAFVRPRKWAAGFINARPCHGTRCRHCTSTCCHSTRRFSWRQQGCSQSGAALAGRFWHARGAGGRPTQACTCMRMCIAFPSKQEFTARVRDEQLLHPHVAACAAEGESRTALAPGGPRTAQRAATNAALVRQRFPPPAASLSLRIHPSRLLRKLKTLGLAPRGPKSCREKLASRHAGPDRPGAGAVHSYGGPR